MKISKTLQSRIIFYFCGYLAILLFVYSIAISGMVKLSEDWAFNRQLSEISDIVLEKFLQEGEIPKNLPMHITAYSDISKIPQPLKKHISDQPPGIFEITDDLDTHAAIVPVGSGGRHLYIFYHVTSIEATDWFQIYIGLLAGGIGLLVLLLGWGIARSLSNRILNPISNLAEAVQSLPLDGNSIELPSVASQDEIGMLSEKINQLLRKISEFTSREREFTSHASHELRTPVSVVKSAVELLDRRIEKTDQKLRDPLERISRSIADIELLISTFLMLARERQDPVRNDFCNLKQIADTVVDKYRYILGSKPVKVEVRVSESSPLSAPMTFVEIALGNLVKNAFQYTIDGKVVINIFKGGVSVQDSGPGFDTCAKPGIGLTIVERLCDKMNWQFIKQQNKGNGTQVDLIFSPDSSFNA